MKRQKEIERVRKAREKMARRQGKKRPDDELSATGAAPADGEAAEGEGDAEGSADHELVASAGHAVHAGDAGSGGVGAPPRE